MCLVNMPLYCANNCGLFAVRPMLLVVRKLMFYRIFESSTPFVANNSIYNETTTHLNYFSSFNSNVNNIINSAQTDHGLTPITIIETVAAILNLYE